MIRSALLVALTATTVAAQGFEGGITMKLTGDNGQATEMTYLVKNGKMRFEVPGGRGSAIMDPASMKLQMVMTEQKMYVEMDLGAVAAASTAGKEPKIVRTGRMETIAGYKCEHIEVTGDDGVTDVCGAKGLGGFMMPALGGRGGPGSPPGWQKALEDMFPLKVVSGGKTVVEVTNIEKKSVDATLFTIPDGFTKLDMGGRGRRGGG